MQKYRLIVMCIVVLAFVQTAGGEVSISVCLADGNTALELADVNTPCVYRDIMVGTKLTIIISSDANDCSNWSGDLFIMGEYQEYGFLSARDFNEITLDWAGSRLPAAGEMARIWDWFEPGVQGFTFEGDNYATMGNWFIIDYTATNEGKCHVALYDHSISWFEPVINLTFSHVPTRDFDDNNTVDFADFAVFASCWQLNLCSEPELCMGADINTDGYIDVKDLFLFAEFWLDSTE